VAVSYLIEGIIMFVALVNEFGIILMEHFSGELNTLSLDEKRYAVIHNMSCCRVLLTYALTVPAFFLDL